MNNWRGRVFLKVILFIIARGCRMYNCLRTVLVCIRTQCVRSYENRDFFIIIIFFYFYFNLVDLEVYTEKR